MKNYKSKSKVILEELAFSQETPKTLEIPPQVSVYVQRGENVLEDEQTQEPKSIFICVIHTCKYTVQFHIPILLSFAKIQRSTCQIFPFTSLYVQ